MIKRSMGKVLIIIVVVLIIMSCTNSCFAISDVTSEGIWSTWEPAVQDSSPLSNKVGNILGIITVIGTIVSVGSLAVIGIKIMLGSVEEKASYKQKMIPWITGAIMVFSVTTIPSIIYNFTRMGRDLEGGTIIDYVKGFDDAISFADAKVQEYSMESSGIVDAYWEKLSQEVSSTRSLYEGPYAEVKSEYYKGYIYGLEQCMEKASGSSFANVRTYIAGVKNAINKINMKVITKENYQAWVSSTDTGEGKRIELQVKIWEAE